MDADGTILLEIITLVSVLGGVGSSVYATKISANNKKLMIWRNPYSLDKPS